MTSPVTGAARSSSPLTLAFENVKKVGNSLNKPEKVYLGRNFQALDHIPKPEESITLAAAQARLKELVDSSENPDKERLEKTIIAVLKMIFQPASSAKPNSSTSDKKGSSESDDKESEAAISEQESERLNLMLDQLTSPLDVSTRKKQNELSVLLLLSDLIFMHRKITNLLIDYHESSSELLKSTNTDLIKMCKSKEITEGVDRMFFRVDPSTPEGIAFLCKWAKLLQAEDSNFYLGNVGELAPLYFNTLRTLASESTGEVKQMAHFLYHSMRWSIIQKEAEKWRTSFSLNLARFSSAIENDRINGFIARHGAWGPLLIEDIEKMLYLPFAEKASAYQKSLELNNKLLRERKKLLKQYRDLYQELHAVGEKYAKKGKKEEFQKFADSRWLASVQKTQAFITPEVLESLSFTHEELLTFESPSKADEKESSVKVDKKKRKKKKASGSKAISNPAADSHSAPPIPTETAPSSPTDISKSLNSPSLSPSRTLFSLEESSEEIDIDSDTSEPTSRSSSPTSFSDIAAKNTFSSLNLDSPSISPRNESTSPQVLDLSAPSSSLGLTTSSSSDSLNANEFDISNLPPSSSRPTTPSSPSTERSPSSNTRSVSAPSSPTPLASLTKSHNGKPTKPLVVANSRPTTAFVSSPHFKPVLDRKYNNAPIARNPSPSGSFLSLSASRDPRSSQSTKAANSRPRAISLTSNNSSAASKSSNRPTSATIARPLTAPTASRSELSKSDRKQSQPSKTNSSFPRSAPLSPSSLTRSFSNKPSSLTSSIVARPLSDEQTPTRSEEASADSKVNVSYTASSSPEQPKRALPRTTSWGHLPSTLVPAIKKEPLDDEKQNKSTRDRILEGGMGAIDYDDRVKKQRKDDPGMRNQPLHEIFCQINTGDLPPEYVIIGYTFNEQSKKCYHRFAAKKSKIEFINAIVNQVKYQVANPTPSESTRLNQAPKEVSEQRNGQTFTFKVLSPHDIVFFKDEHGNEYRLFKMQ